MKYSQSIVAKQYAKAYLREYSADLKLDDLANMKAAVRFFRRHHNFMSLVSLLCTSKQSGLAIIEELFQHFLLPESLKKLIPVLINHKRLVLFAQVLQDICCLYFVSNNFLELTVFTATPLDDAELEQFEKFFIKLSSKQIISSVVLDKSLIAGVRMQSDFFLWEYSIAARLRALRQKLLIEG